MSDDRQVFSVVATDDGALALAGELDSLSVGDLKRALAISNGEGNVTLELSGLTFIDSSGLHAIAEYVTSRGGDGTVTLSGVSPHILRVLEITRLIDLANLRIHG